MTHLKHRILQPLLSNSRFLSAAVFVLVLFAVQAVPTRAQWTESGTNDVYKTTTTGNVGIGTTTPGVKLDVVSTGSTIARFNASTGSSAFIGLQNAGVTKWSFGNRLSDHRFVFLNESVGEVFTMLQSGKVGIGTPTPLSNLDIRGANTATDSYGNLFVRTNSAQGAEVGGQITFGGMYNTGTGYGGWAAVAGRKDNSTSGDWAGHLSFSTAANASAITERMRITSSGNVGLGTTSPLYRAHIFGTNALPSLNTVSGVLAVDGGNATNQLTIGSYGASPYGVWLQAKDNANGGGSGYAYPLLLNPLGGSVGIGTSNPAEKLHVVGNIYATGNITCGGNCGGGGAVTSVFGRTGVVTAAANDYTWAQINKTTSSLAELTTRNAGDLSSGTLHNDRFPATLPSVSGANLTNLNAGSLAAGTVATARLGSGTANSTTFLRGDNSWAPLVSSQWSNTGSHISFSSGNVGIGVANPTSAKLEILGDIILTGTGNITANGTINAGTINAKYQDVAEWVPSTHALPAGTVVTLDPTKNNHVEASSKAYDTRVAGVISAQPGITLGEAGANRVLVATTGRVKLMVDAAKGPIQIGDLLVTSDSPGVAMKSEAINVGGVQMHRPGTLIGKALEPLAKGRGVILVLLSLQ